MELILLAAGVFLGYFVGVNLGYRLKVRELDSKHCAVLFVEKHGDNYLFYDYLTKAFLFQGRPGQLAKLIREEIAQDNVVVFNFQKNSFLALDMSTGKYEGLDDTI